MSKEIKSKIVPKLRFPEFKASEEWDRPTLEDISNKIEEKVGQQLLTTVSISAGIGFVSQAEKFSRDISGQQYKNYFVLKEGEFAYNKGNSKRFPQGCIYKLKEFKKAAAPNAFICFKIKDKYTADFYSGYFDNNFHGKQLHKFITSGARMDGLLNISVRNFFSIILPTPKSKAEQQKIASCLSSLDEYITAESQKLEALKTHKKGLMQQLFPAEGERVPKLRFPEFMDSGEWEEKKLGNICSNIASGKSKIDVNGEFDLYGSTGVIGKTNDYCCDGNFILVARVGANAGLLTRANEKFGVTDNTLIVSLHDTENIDFIYFTLEKFGLNKLIFGSGQPLITGGQLKSLIINLPKPDEQQKIASCLSSLDDLITAQTEKIEALKVHKKGLMQGLFPELNEINE